MQPCTRKLAYRVAGTAKTTVVALRYYPFSSLCYENGAHYILHFFVHKCTRLRKRKGHCDVKHIAPQSFQPANGFKAGFSIG
jgi:hypothetical protein